jgi:uncharacterized protein YkwD
MKSIKIISAVFVGFIVVFLLVVGFSLYKFHQLNKQNTDTIQNSNTSSPGKFYGPTTANSAKSLETTKILEWTNFYREQNKLSALKLNNNLTQAAQEKTEDMFTQQYFEHVSPDGTTPADLVLAAGYNYKFTGENLALGDFKNEKELVDAWMASPGHRANILSTSYTEIGIFAKLGGIEQRNTWLAVQEFGKPDPNCAIPDTQLSAQIKEKKAEYEKITDQIKTLNQEAQDLAEEANSQITQGNEIFESTRNQKEADTYWQKGDDLRSSSDEKLSEATGLKTQSDTLYQELSKLVEDYNKQVNIYNDCIK